MSLMRMKSVCEFYGLRSARRKQGDRWLHEPTYASGYQEPQPLPGLGSQSPLQHPPFHSTMGRPDCDRRKTRESQEKKRYKSGDNMWRLQFSDKLCVPLSPAQRSPGGVLEYVETGEDAGAAGISDYLAESGHHEPHPFEASSAHSPTQQPPSHGTSAWPYTINGINESKDTCQQLGTTEKKREV